jgi:4-amino-4-deoxy-L-arabinose transferase-like glycosyltransferase
VLPCTTVRTAVLLFLLALAVRLVLVAGFADPAYPDSFYYVDVARSLASGHGFSVDFVWIFAEVGGTVPPNPILPIASNGHWMPLASIVQVPFIWLLGPSAFASALPFAICGALAAPIARGIAVEAGASRRIALGAGILGAVPALATPFMAQPDNFGLYQPLVAAALWMAARGLKGHARSYALAGLLVGVATLARNDGVLVGAAVGLAFLWDRWRAWRSGGARIPAIPVWAAVACAGLFVLVVAPWVARQLAVFGTISPSTASGKVLFIRDIGEWNSITTPATLQHLLGQGIGPLIASRVDGLLAAITIFSVLIGGVLLAPFMVVGAWRRRRSRDFGPFLTYAAILSAFSALISAVHVPGGTFIHSAIALAPGSYVLALEGIVAAVAWIAARRRSWDRAAAERVFTAGAVGFALVAAVMGSITTQAVWAARRDDLRAVAAALDAVGAPAADRVMSIDASGARYWTGRGGVVLVNDPLGTVEQVARGYDIRWLVVNRADSVAAVSPLLAGQRPAWVGAPILSTADAGGEVRLAVFPVCTVAGDARCGAATP